jgi:arginase
VSRRVGLIGVPSSAGAHWPGQEKAPRALRDAGLVERLQSAGCAVVDRGDMPRVRFRPDGEHRRPHNLAAVVGVARGVAEHVESALRDGEVPLVVGGDCTIELGVLSGFLRAGQGPTLLYLDGGLDLRTPADNPTGILDSMGVAHMIGEPGAAEELARIGPRFPLMPDDRIVYFGYEPAGGAPFEGDIAERRGIARYPAGCVREGPTQAANEALGDLTSKAERFVVHFDVDVIDFYDLPAADVPLYNTGLTKAEAMTALAEFVAHPGFAGMTFAEFNPDHGEPGGATARALAESLAGALRPLAER